MSTLIEIGLEMDDLEKLLDASVESDGELLPEQEALFDAWFADLEQRKEEKLDGYAGLIEKYTLLAASAGDASKRAARREEIRTNLVKKLKGRLKDWMEARKIKKAETSRYLISVSGNGGKLGIETGDLADLPPDCKRTTVEPDTDAIRKRLERGEKIPGWKLKERGTHLRVA